MEKHWSKIELSHLKRHADDQSVEELAQRFHTDVEAVRLKLAELGLDSNTSAQTDAATFKEYEEALEQLHEGKWGKAAEAFKALIQNADHQQIVDRARQNLLVCERYLEEPREGEDPYLVAVFEKNNGNFSEALELCQAQGAALNDEKYAYLEASIQALAGEEDQALELLETAIRLQPKNRVHAYHDSDFKDLRGTEQFSSLISADA
jgi:tetratricopeptide (TPR) repeat protein